MAEVKITDLVELNATPDDADLLEIVDVGGTPTSKKITVANLRGGLASSGANLAIGSANYKLFVNAAGNAAEWANGIVVLNVTRALDAAAGDVSYSGVGFKPSSAIFVAGLSNHGISIGMDNMTAKGVSCVFAAAYTPNHNNFSIWIANAGNTVYQYAFIKSFDSDGFTLTWAGVGSEAITYRIRCFLLR